MIYHLIICCDTFLFFLFWVKQEEMFDKWYSLLWQNQNQNGNLAGITIRQRTPGVSAHSLLLLTYISVLCTVININWVKCF